MKKLSIIIFAFIFAFTSLISMQTTVAQTSNNMTFNDLNSHWAKDSIQIMAQNGVVKGYKDGSFKPDNSVTAGEAITFLTRLLESNLSELPQTSLPQPIKQNVEDVHWSYDNTINLFQYYGAIGEDADLDISQELNDLGLQLFSNGKSQWQMDQLQYNRPLSRQDVTVLLWPLFRAQLMNEAGKDDDTYQTKLSHIKNIQKNLLLDLDANTDNSVYPFVAAHFQVITGYQDHTFRPERPVTRAEMMVILQRVSQFLNIYSQNPQMKIEFTADYYPLTEGDKKDFVLKYDGNSTGTDPYITESTMIESVKKDTVTYINYSSGVPKSKGILTTKNGSGVYSKSLIYIDDQYNELLQQNFSPEILTFKFGTYPGDIWYSEGEIEALDTFFYQYKYTSWYEKNEIINTPVGRLNTIKVTSIMEHINKVDKSTILIEYWLAKDIGTVRKSISNVTDQNLTGITSDLTSFTQIPENKNVVYNMNDYYPLQEGMQWEYDTEKYNRGQLEKQNRRSEVTEVKGENIYLDYQQDDRKGHELMKKMRDGIYYVYYNEVGNEYKEIFEPALLKFPKEIMYGVTWKSANTFTTVDYDGKIYDYKYKADYTLEGIETVKVPAGTFETIKIKADMQIIDQKTGHVLLNFSTIWWLAKDIGIVKKLRVFSESQTVEKKELTKFQTK